MFTILTAAVIVFIVSFVLLYAAALYHTGYWRRRGVPGPPSRPFVGNMNAWFRRTPMALKIREWSKQYGKTYGVQEGFYNTFVTSDVRLLHELFVTKFEYFHGRRLSPENGNVDTLPDVNVFLARGARWKRLRAIANPVFSVNNLKKILSILHDSTYNMMDYIEKTAQQNSSININDHFYELSMDVIMRVAMGQRGSKQFRNVEHIKTVKAMFESFGKSRLFYYGRIVGPLFENVIHYASMAYDILTRSPMAVFLDYVSAEIHKRKDLRKKGVYTDEGHIDFIDLFLDLECCEVTEYKTPDKTFGRATSKISKEITIDEMKAQCFVFLLAGFDTTANTLSVTCHYLARHEEVQNCLRDEILVVCGDDEKPTYEQLNQLRYADAVMKETLRLCPIAGLACARQCCKTTTLGEYTIEEGTYVQADVWSIHYDKAIWGEDAAEFRPERWLENEGTRSPIEWMSFGAGPRLCIGMRLAYLEEKLALVSLLRKFVIRTAPDSEVTMNLDGDVVLSPERVTVQLVPVK